jgi:prenyl protein peptidase
LALITRPLDNTLPFFLLPPPQQPQGVPRLTLILTTPLFFGSAHLHHLRELTKVQGLPLGQALAAVAFQFAYTTVFGWLATWVFVATGHALAPAAVHAACNAIGVPPFGAMGRARAGGVPVLWWATAVGVAAFWWWAGRILDPRAFNNTAYYGFGV